MSLPVVSLIRAPVWHVGALVMFAWVIAAMFAVWMFVVCSGKVDLVCWCRDPFFVALAL